MTVIASITASSVFDRFEKKHSPRSTKREFCGFVSGVCSNATAPSVSSINRILRNRAAERAAAEFARAAGYGLYAAGPHPYFNSGHQHPTTSHHLAAAGWPAPGAAAHPWMLPPLATGISGAASALLLPPSLSPGAAAASASAAPDHSLHADAIARGYLQGDCRFHLREGVDRKWKGETSGGFSAQTVTGTKGAWTGRSSRNSGGIGPRSARNSWRSSRRNSNDHTILACLRGSD